MRLFFALWPQELLAEMLTDVAERCSRRFGGRPMRVATIHMTLAFLGERPQADLPRITAAARTVRMKPFDLSLDRLGCWRHERLLWAGCQSLPSELQDLVDSLQGGLLNAGIAFNEAGRRFFPHVTLVRQLPAQAFPLALPTLPPLFWHCQNFVLVESRLSDVGATYRVIDAFG